MASLVEKRLAGPTQPASTGSVLATVPTGHRYVVKQIILANTDTVTRTISLSIGSSGTAANRFVAGMSLSGNEVVVLDTTLVLEAGETLEAVTSASTTINVVATGWDHTL